MIGGVIARNELVLNGKFKERLETSFKDLHRMTEKFAKSNFEIENNPEVFKIKQDMDSFNM